MIHDKIIIYYLFLNPIQYLAHVVGWDATHVIMHCRYYRNRVPSDIHTSKDHGGLRDARKACLECLCWQMRQLKVDMVLVRSNTSET